MSESARIVLVKPGDVLIFGNVSVDLDSPLIAAAMTQLKETFGLAHILLFEDDIDLAVQQGRDDILTGGPAAEGRDGAE